MRGIDLVIAVGTDQQHVLHIPLGQEILEHRERARIEPLQIVEEERQRMVGRANTPRNRRTTSWKRRCAFCGARSGTAAGRR